MIVTVTLNAAIDRTLTVPNFQRGQRHRASLGLTLAGGKGLNVARALKRLGVPVIATGLAGGRTGTRIVEELTTESILNDFVRIAGESRTSTAVVDPTSSSYTEINEWGPAVNEGELATLREKLHYLVQGAEYVVFAGSLPRDVPEDFYAEAIRELNRRGVRSVLDCEGEPLRLGVAAEPFLVSPNQVEAESLVGHEFHDDEDFQSALDQIAEMGARNVLITQEMGAVALLREDRERRRFRVVAPRVEAVSTVGARRRPARRVPGGPRRGAPDRGVAPRGGRGRRRVDARDRRRSVRPSRVAAAPVRRRAGRARARRLQGPLALPDPDAAVARRRGMRLLVLLCRRTHPCRRRVRRRLRRRWGRRHEARRHHHQLALLSPCRGASSAGRVRSRGLM